MTWAAAYTAIKDRFRAGWDATPVSFENGEGSDNKPFKPPKSGKWVMLELVWNGSDEGAVDSAFRRRMGHVWIHAFIPSGTGADDAHSLAAEGAAIFEEQDFAGLAFEQAQPGGPTSYEAPDGNWYGQSASIPFTYDEVRK